jgi:hypothetical protein
MRAIRYLLDLPWWVGLIIFLLGNLIVDHWYIVGLPVCLFGAWTYSKLLPPVDDPVVERAIFGFPLFFLAMLIPDQFAFEHQRLTFMNGASSQFLFGLRAAISIGVGFMAFQGVRK